MQKIKRTKKLKQKLKPNQESLQQPHIWILALVSNVLILEERNSSTLLNKSLDLERETENKRGRETENRMGRETNNRRRRRSRSTKKRIGIYVLTW